MPENNIIYTVEEVIKETANVSTLKLSCEGGLPPYKAGQFITVFFPETGHMEGKSYSISSSPSEKTLNLTVKGMGAFSNKLLAKQPGDTITGSLPYGYFYSESDTSSLVILTGGIGIAPFRSMILHVLEKHPGRKILLLYSNKTKDSIIWKKEFDELAAKSGGALTLHYYLTQEETPEGMIPGRIIVDDIAKELHLHDDAEFFLCGSIAFVRDYWKGLKEAGVLEEKIYTEAFF